MTRDERTDLLQHALMGYQAQYEQIENKIAELRRQLGRHAGATAPRNGAVPEGDAEPKHGSKKHGISKAGRARIAAATKERWRKARAAGRTALG